MEPVEILYQCPELAVCVKPAGILSQAGKPGESSMVSLLSQQLDAEVYPIHRLDKEVGGVMVYAKTRSAAADLSRQLQQGILRKEYLAVLCGAPEPQAGALVDLLYHDRSRNKTYVVKRSRKGIKEARLQYRVLDVQAEYALAQIRLLSGRTHQIRAQFASRGLPLLGDGRYGGGSGQIQLWSMALSLQLPDGSLRRFLRLPEALGPFFPIEDPGPLKNSSELQKST